MHLENRILDVSANLYSALKGISNDAKMPVDIAAKTQTGNEQDTVRVHRKRICQSLAHHVVLIVRQGSSRSLQGIIYVVPENRQVLGKPEKKTHQF